MIPRPGTESGGGGRGRLASSAPSAGSSSPGRITAGAAGSLGIRPGEARVVGLVVGVAFMAMMSYTVGQTGIDALFFDRVGARALPIVYLFQGGTTFATMIALTAGLGRLGPRRAYLSAPLVLGAVVVAERALLLADARWVYFVLAVTATLGTLILGISVWGVGGAVVDTRQAKRLFPIFAAGGILGSVVGGLATGPLARVIGTENLLFVWAGGSAAAFALSRLVLGPKVSSPARRVARQRLTAVGELIEGLRFVRRSRLLSWMTLAAVLFSVVFYVLYLPFAGAATERFPDPNSLAGFLGLFWAAGTLSAFVVSILVTNRLFAWRGVAAAVMVLPVLYAGGFAVLLLGSGFATLVTLRFVLGVWLQGVASPGWETLTNVVPEPRRSQTRAFLNGGPTQIGTMIAGVVGIVWGGSLTVRGFAVIGLIAAVATLVATVGIRRSHAGALAAALRAARPQVFDPPAMDRAPTPCDVPGAQEPIRAFVKAATASAIRDRDLAAAIPADDNSSRLLRDALVDRGRRSARSGLVAAARFGAWGDAMRTAIEDLDGDPAQVATAMETLETAGDPALVRPLLVLWEPLPPRASGAADWLGVALRDDDPFIRECAEFIRTRRDGSSKPGSVAARSSLERALFLRTVPVFAALSPMEIERMAQLSEERVYADMDVIAAEGELGEEVHVVMEGTVRVVRGPEGSEREIARSGAGEVVGEMSPITGAPRVASLVADGSVRTFPIGRREFASILRERPTVGVAVMRVLAERLAASERIPVSVVPLP